MVPAKELDDLRWINRVLADGESRIKEQREIIADLGLLGADRTRAKPVLDAMLSTQAECERYREMLLRESTELHKPDGLAELHKGGQIRFVLNGAITFREIVGNLAVP